MTPDTQSRSMVPRVESPSPAPLDKAAIIMIALDDERSQRIFSRLDHEEIRCLSRAMAKLGRADANVVEQAIAEFRSEVGRTGNVLGTVEGTERILLRILPPDKVADIMGELKGPGGGDIWGKLANLQPQPLAGYLRNESAQTIAVILARLPPEQAARVLRLLPETLTVEIAVRMARLDSVQHSVLAGIEETLERELMGELSRAGGPDSTTVLAELLNRSDRALADRVLAGLEERVPDAAGRVRKLMFTFDDLGRIDPATFGVLIAECSADKLAIALSAAGEELRTLFLSNMSERAGNMLREEIESLPPQRKRAVEEAQTEIVVLAKRLADDGRIFLLEAGEEAAPDE